jgi:inhibitor of KinA sporulation pathway (predicted exonuclease)
MDWIMSNNFKTITVIDLEATCWDDDEYQKKHSEIIEIGLAVINIKEEQIKQVKSIYVIPEKLINERKSGVSTYKAISDYCINLTGITESKLLKQGKTLKAASAEIMKHYPYSKTWMSWGYYDKSFLEKECIRKHVTFPFSKYTHMNASLLYSLINKNKKGTGLKKAMDKLGIPFDGKQHSGKDDAYNTAKVIYKLLYNKDIK